MPVNNLPPELKLKKHEPFHEKKYFISKKKEYAVIQCLLKGGTLRDAAMMAGVSVRRLMNRIEHCAKFAKRFDRARVECKMHHLGRIHEGAKAWQASAWYLSRAYRKEFGEVGVVKPTGDENKRAIRVRRYVRNSKVNDIKSEQQKPVATAGGEDLPTEIDRERPYLRLTGTEDA